ncbi:hypothetical protein [Microtetraspora sp. NBRC 13810]|uniref:hypothetical protein n=1 Tax=Microtetraspora sp. NBRC 13810 TaxID=3030990 RepID=UPI002553A62A|nr:hypothetical protein [Microtetraspora sp. NBRC 13810]
MRERDPRPPLGFLIPGGFAFSVACCALVALVLPADTVLRAAAMGVAVAAYAAWARHPMAALATGVMAWFLTTGFLVNALGVLTFAGADEVRLGAFAAAALLGCAGAALWGLVTRARRHGRPFPPITLPAQPTPQGHELAARDPHHV